MKKLLVLVPIVVAAVIAWGVIRKNRPPEVSFVRAVRQRLVSSLPTNGKVEPFEWQAVRAKSAGVVGSVPAREGQAVEAGTTLATLSEPSVQAEIDAAEAKLAGARAQLAAAQAGGKPAEIAELENSLERARLDLELQKRETEALGRLSAKQAATRAEVAASQDKIRQLETEIAGLEKRRGSMVARTDVSAAQALVQEAQAAVTLARQRSSENVIRAPIPGVVYELSARPGAYLNPGDLVANVGRLDQLRVRVYVDEPELGRVSEGDPVVITWDALPGKRWEGAVERKPASIQALGSRQVGEVVCTIANPERELTTGANVNAEIRTAVVDDALVIPKETLRRDGGGDYVFLLAGDHVERRAVKTGVSSITLVQIVDGLKEGDAVAAPSEVPLQAGRRVEPTVR